MINVIQQKPLKALPCGLYSVLKLALLMYFQRFRVKWNIQPLIKWRGCLVGKSIPNTWMKSIQGRPSTG